MKQSQKWERNKRYKNQQVNFGRGDKGRTREPSRKFQNSHP